MSITETTEWATSPGLTREYGFADIKLTVDSENRIFTPDNQRLPRDHELFVMLTDPEQFPFRHGVVVDGKNQELIAQAQELQRFRFFQDNHAELGEDDPYVDQSDYFVTLNSMDQVVATMRIIKDSGFPDKTRFFKEEPVRRFLEGIKADVKPEEIVEISSLAGNQDYPKLAAIHLYRDMIKHCVDNDYKIAVMAVVEDAFQDIKYLFKDAIIQLREPVQFSEAYCGQTLIPSMISTELAVKLFAESTNDDLNNPKKVLHQNLVEYFLTENTTIEYFE